MVALYVLPLVVLAVFHIRPYAGERKILIPTIQGFHAVIGAGDKPPAFIKDRLHGKLVMLKCKVCFRSSVIGVLRADMFYRCHRLPQSL